MCQHTFADSLRTSQATVRRERTCCPERDDLCFQDLPQPSDALSCATVESSATRVRSSRRHFPRGRVRARQP